MVKQATLVPITPIWRADLMELRGRRAAEVDNYRYSETVAEACNQRFANEYVDFYLQREKLSPKEFQSRLDQAGWISKEVKAHIAEQWNILNNLKAVAGYKDVVVIIRGVKYNRVRGPKGYFVGEIVITPEGVLQPKQKLVPVKVLMERRLAQMLAKEAKRERQKVVKLLKTVRREQAVRQKQEKQTRDAIRKGKFKL